MSSLTSLAESLLARSKLIDAHLETKGIAYPSHHHDTLSCLPKELQQIRHLLADGSNELKKLAQGPVAQAKELSYGWTDILSLRFIWRYDLAKILPLDGSMTYRELASASGLPESLVKQFLRTAFANNIFEEDKSGLIRHTELSRLLREDCGFSAAIGLQVEDNSPVGSAYMDSIERFGIDTDSPRETAFNFHNKTEDPFYSFIHNVPARGKRFSTAMQWLAQDEGFNLRHILDSFDWNSIDQGGLRIVDIGGGYGNVSQYLAQHTSFAEFIVQDYDHVVDSAKKMLDPALRERVYFERHDFMDPQPSQPVDVFILRWVLHNWSDRFCNKILQNLIPALRSGSRVLIYEVVIDEQPRKDLIAKEAMAIDIMMTVLFNGRERTKAEFSELIRTCDPRFVLKRIKQPEGSTQSLLEVEWTG